MKRLTIELKLVSMLSVLFASQLAFAASELTCAPTAKHVLAAKIVDQNECASGLALSGKNAFYCIINESGETLEAGYYQMCLSQNPGEKQFTVLDAISLTYE